MTTTQPRSWEHTLLSLAFEGRQTGVETAPHTWAKTPSLDAAYAHCAVLTARYSQSFYLASALLPHPKRRAMRALYAFCRRSDDIVDQPRPAPQEHLAQWRRASLYGEPPKNDSVIQAWMDTRRRYRIPTRYAEQLLDGVSQDLSINRYQTFEQLAAYAYGVASTVGLMSMYITGFHSPAAIPYAIKLGVALQLTNILRDIGQDLRMGRIYLPQAELSQYGLGEQDLHAGRVDRRWRAFMRFQIARNRRLYAEALPGIALLDQDGRFAVAAASRLYQMILEQIEKNDYNVFTQRAFVGKWQKLAALPGIWRWTRHSDSLTPYPGNRTKPVDRN